MYKLCKTEQSANRQQVLENGLLTAMLSRHYEEVSVSDLCDQMGVPRKSFYRYFSSKDGALHALLDHTLMDYENHLLNDNPRTIQMELERFFHFWLHRKPLLDALQRSNLCGMLVARAIDHALASAFIPRQLLAPDNREVQDEITAFAVCGLMSMVIRWHHLGYPHSPAHMAGLAVRMISQPLFSNVRHFI